MREATTVRHRANSSILELAPLGGALKLFEIKILALSS